MKENFLDTLNNQTKKIQRIEQEKASLQNSLERNSNELSIEETSWKELKDEYVRQVKSGAFSTGDPLKDYTFAQHDFYDASDFPTNFKEETGKLKFLLGLISETKTFWHSRINGYGNDQIKIYELLFLKNTPYTITPNQITFHGESSLELKLEPVFLNQAHWPFITKDSSNKDIEVKPTGVRIRTHEGDIELNGNRTRIHTLEETLKHNDKNLIALGAFKYQISHQISPELQKTIDEQIHTISTQALGIIKKNYSEIRLKEEEIQKIKEEYDPDNAKSGEYSRIPVAVGESDPFMARLMSYESRVGRNNSVFYLAKCIDDLDKTGLANYTKPIETRLMQGEKKVSSLAEVSNYIRNVLEIKVKSIEAQMNQQTA